MNVRYLVMITVMGAILACAGGRKSKKKRQKTPKEPAEQVAPTPASDAHEIAVDALGHFSPATRTISKGDTVRWTFASPKDTVIGVPAGLSADAACDAIGGYHPDVPAGPIITRPAGIFTLSPDGDGFAELSAKDTCSAEQSLTIGDQQICLSGEPYRTMDATWNASGVTGVFIRLRWNQIQTGPNQYDWRVVDREVQRAVDAGKQYAIGIKAGKNGTPDWIFTSGGVERLSFQDWGSSDTKDCKRKKCCGYPMDLGSPADDAYRKQYFGMLESLGAHLQEDASWFRALAMVKPSGLNLLSHENRLPNRCEPGCACNTEVWAKADNPYTPEALISFYEAQFKVIERAFPGKTISYMLIQAGFPLVRDKNNYLGGGTHNLPKGTEQTEDIIAMGYAQHGQRFAVQHNGLGPGPRKENASDAPCAKGKKREGSGENCPSAWVIRSGNRGMVTGFQTVNGAKCGDAATLDRTLLNVQENSNAVFVEVYEQRAWEATATGGALDAKGSNRSLEEWNQALHQRAATSNTYTYTFDGSEKAVSFVSAARCGDNPTVGTIQIQ